MANNTGLLYLFIILKLEKLKIGLRNTKQATITMTKLNIIHQITQLFFHVHIS
jgi:hypothetical protein